MNTLAAQYRLAVDALNRGDFVSARRLAQRVRSSVPAHGGVCFVEGVAALQLGDLQHAVCCLQDAVRLNPARSDYRAQYARALATARLFREAVEVLHTLDISNIADPLTLDTVGVVFTQANEHTRASVAFERAVVLSPNHPSFHFNLATSRTFLGNLEGAKQAYEECLQIMPSYWKAHLALAQLRSQTVERNHLDRLRGLLDTSSSPEARMYLNLALAKELEDIGDYANSFSHLTAGKSAGLEGRNYRFERDDALVRALMDTPPPVPSVAGYSAEPIFVLGMPRSGTTLVDRILSSHSHVQSAGELQNFGVVLKRISGSRTPSLLDVDTIRRAGSADLSDLGARYIASTRPGTGQRRHFVDKLPHNFLYAGFIAGALPDARIVCVHRDPLDTCLSNFRQLFALSSPYYDYSFALETTARYVVLFERLMAHWERVMPARILHVRYEDVVDDQAAQTRRLLDYVGLDFEEACLAFDKNPSPVATASAVQVRSPLFRTSLGRWRRYRDEMAPAIEIFRKAGIVTKGRAPHAGPDPLLAYYLPNV